MRVCKNIRISANAFITSLVGGKWLAEFNAAPSLVKAGKYNKALAMLGGKEVFYVFNKWVN